MIVNDDCEIEVGRGNEAQELSRPGSMAKGDGSGSGLLSHNEEVSEERNLWAD